ncbi:hypothetical protein [Falsibacillus pallidus]|uniref:hypothetical protein n=1 Tax=Falsibacillus pallidus TaxID=493781 RepID=UPI003D98238B
MNNAEANELTMDTTKVKSKLITAGFYIGLASILLAELGIVPLTGFIISIIGLVKYDKEKNKGLWMGIVGMILNFLYLLSNAHMNGHLG